LGDDRGYTSLPCFHGVNISAGTVLVRVAGNNHLHANSFHHQAIKDTGRGLRISARATDGIIEAVEGTGRFPLLGVQFHPERMWESDPAFPAIFRWLMARCGQENPRIALIYRDDEARRLESGDDEHLQMREAIEKSGGQVVDIVQGTESSVLARQLQSVDGFLFPGGSDIDPSHYGEARHEKLGNTSYDFDRFEMDLLRYAESREKPVLGICRGCQMINVYFGGTLYQDLPSQYGDALPHRIQVADSAVEISPETSPVSMNAVFERECFRAA